MKKDELFQRLKLTLNDMLRIKRQEDRLADFLNEHKQGQMEGLKELIDITIEGTDNCIQEVRDAIAKADQCRTGNERIELNDSLATAWGVTRHNFRSMRSITRHLITEEDMVCSEAVHAVISDVIANSEEYTGLCRDADMNKGVAALIFTVSIGLTADRVKELRSLINKIDQGSEWTDTDRELAIWAYRTNGEILGLIQKTENMINSIW